jgi:hypothetical protein
MQFAAPNYTHVAANQTAAALTGVGTSSVLIYGILIDATAGTGTVTILEGDGTTTIQVLTITTGFIPFGFPLLWLASKGCKITTSASVTCTVFHGNPSA